MLSFMIVDRVRAHVLSPLHACRLLVDVEGAAAALRVVVCGGIPSISPPSGWIEKEGRGSRADCPTDRPTDRARELLGPVV